MSSFIAHIGTILARCVSLISASGQCKLQIILGKNTPFHANNKQIKYEKLDDVKSKIASEIIGFRILTNWQFNQLTA